MPIPPRRGVSGTRERGDRLPHHLATQRTSLRQRSSTFPKENHLRARYRLAPGQGPQRSWFRRMGQGPGNLHLWRAAQVVQIVVLQGVEERVDRAPRAGGPAQALGLRTRASKSQPVSPAVTLGEHCFVIKFLPAAYGLQFFYKGNLCCATESKRRQGLAGEKHFRYHDSAGSGHCPAPKRGALPPHSRHLIGVGSAARGQRSRVESRRTSCSSGLFWSRREPVSSCAAQDLQSGSTVKGDHGWESASRRRQIQSKVHPAEVWMLPWLMDSRCGHFPTAGLENSKVAWAHGHVTRLSDACYSPCSTPGEV